VEDQPADRVVFGLVLEPQLEAEELLELVHGRSPIHPRLVLRDPDDQRFLDVVLVLDLADDLLEQVFDGDQACCSPVLVEDDGHVHPPALELVQDVVDGQ
jgi:hypothetical protein